MNKPEIAPCDSTIYSRGETIALLHTMGPDWIESWVRKVAKTSGQPVDWHYAGGRANVLALGDIKLAQHVANQLLPEFEEAVKDRLA